MRAKGMVVSGGEALTIVSEILRSRKGGSKIDFHAKEKISPSGRLAKIRTSIYTLHCFQQEDFYVSKKLHSLDSVYGSNS
jgi:hypothetical protein